MYIKLFTDQYSTPEEINQTLINYHKLITYHEALNGVDKADILEQLYTDLNVFLDEISRYNPFIKDMRELQIRDKYFGFLYELGVLRNIRKLTHTYRHFPIIC